LAVVAKAARSDPGPASEVVLTGMVAADTVDAASSQVRKHGAKGFSTWVGRLDEFMIAEFDLVSSFNAKFPTGLCKNNLQEQSNPGPRLSQAIEESWDRP